MTDEQMPGSESDSRGSDTGGDEIEAVKMSRAELVAEADQFLDLSGADPETPTEDQRGSAHRSVTG